MSKRKFTRKRKSGNSQVKKNTRAIARLKNDIEVKWFTDDFPLAALAVNNFFLELNDVEQGLTEQDRIGNDIAGKSMDINIMLQNRDAAPQYVRVTLVRDMQPNGLQFVTDLLYNNTATQIETTNTVLNPFFDQRFKVYKDVVVRLSTQGATGNNNAGNLTILRWKINLAGLKTKFIPAVGGGGVASMESNMLAILVTTNVAAAASIFLGISHKYGYTDA